MSASVLIPLLKL